jgi:hypothetical protein
MDLRLLAIVITEGRVTSLALASGAIEILKSF